MPLTYRKSFLCCLRTLRITHWLIDRRLMLAIPSISSMGCSYFSVIFLSFRRSKLILTLNFFFFFLKVGISHSVEQLSHFFNNYWTTLHRQIWSSSLLPYLSWVQMWEGLTSCQCEVCVEGQKNYCTTKYIIHYYNKIYYSLLICPWSYCITLTESVPFNKLRAPLFHGICAL